MGVIALRRLRGWVIVQDGETIRAERDGTAALRELLDQAKDNTNESLYGRPETERAE